MPYKSEEPTVSRLFFVGMALFLMAVVFAGFGPTYFVSFLGLEPVEGGLMEISRVIHLHAAVFVGWMVLLLTQTGLVAWDKSQTHMRLGQYGVVFGLIVVAIGALMAFLQWQAGVSQGNFTWAEAPFRKSHGWIGISQFAILLGFGYRSRTRPPKHKRYMLFATIALVQAANTRLVLLLGKWSNEIMTVAIVAPIWIYDHYDEGRIHPATLLGTGIVGLFFVLPPLLA